MRTSTKRTTPKQRSDVFLQPIAEAAGALRGSKKQLAAALSKRTGESVPRERVERWLKKDPAKRQQPLLGSGLLLLEEFNKLFAKPIKLKKPMKEKRNKYQQPKRKEMK
jgi:hypothetical protein